jgi:hypothetical protein
MHAAQAIVSFERGNAARSLSCDARRCSAMLGTERRTSERSRSGAFMDRENARGDLSFFSRRPRLHGPLFVHRLSRGPYIRQGRADGAHYRGVPIVSPLYYRTLFLFEMFTCTPCSDQDPRPPSQMTIPRIRPVTRGFKRVFGVERCVSFPTSFL